MPRPTLERPRGQHRRSGSHARSRYWLTPEEFAQLTPTERNQRALDRYLASRKAPWELARDYSRREFAGIERAGEAIDEAFEGLRREGFVAAEEVADSH